MTGVTDGGIAAALRTIDFRVAELRADLRDARRERDEALARLASVPAVPEDVAGLVERLSRFLAGGNGARRTLNEAIEALQAQAAEIEDLTGKLEVAMAIVRGAQAAHDAERQHRSKLRDADAVIQRLNSGAELQAITAAHNDTLAKLRKAVKILRLCADGLESNGQGRGGDVIISEKAFGAVLAFLATMEKPSE